MANGVRTDSSDDGSARGKGAGADPTKKGKKGITIGTTRPGNAPSTVYMGQQAPPNVPFAVSPRPVAVDIDQAETAYTTPDAYNRFMTGDWKTWIDGLAKSIDYRRTGSSLWGDAIKASQALEKQGVKVSPMQYLIDLAKEREYTAGTDAANANARGTTASRRISRSSERDIRATADAIASEVLGRAITDEELARILPKIRSAETEEAQYGGLDATGQKDIITDMLMKGPEAKEFAMATTMMDAFYGALSEGPSGS